MTQSLSFCSGSGQFHTNEAGAANPRPYIPIPFSEIQAMVDCPLSVDKTQARWVIPSALQSCQAAAQNVDGQYGFVWADLDDSPPSMQDLAMVMAVLIGSSDYEAYNTRSATQANPKARILIPLESPLNPADWTLAQQALNDYLELLGIHPDRASERPAQLCYLPNRGEYYESVNQRVGVLFDPLVNWAAEIAAKRVQARAAKAALDDASLASLARKQAALGSGKPDLIASFNASYPPEHWLSAAGYDVDRNGNYRHPASQSGSYSCGVLDGRVKSLSSNDLLYCETGSHDSFGVFTILNHAGDHSAALRDAGDNLVMMDGCTFNEYARRAYKANYELSGLSEQFTAALANVHPPIPTTMVRPIFGFKSASELTAKPAPIDWLVKGFIERQSLNLLFGEPGAGKSLFALEWAFCIAAGIDWNGYATKQANVVIIAGEGLAGLRRRIKALELKYSIPAPDGLYISEQPANFLDSANIACVGESIKSLSGDVGLVIIDTLHRNMTGDENSAADIAAFIQNIDTHLKPLGCATLIAHHSGHAEKGRSRGSSSIRAAMDAEFGAVKTDDEIILTNHKAKDFEPVAPLKFDLTPVELDWFDDDGEALSSVYLTHTGAASKGAGKTKSVSPRNAAILKTLETAIALDGIPTPEHIPKDMHNQKVCLISDWRKLAYPTISPSGDEPLTIRTLQKAFNRSRATLFKDGFIVEFGDYVWLVDKKQKPTTFDALNARGHKGTRGDNSIIVSW